MTSDGGIELVGHVLRRCHQVHHAVWTEEVGDVLTSPQYSVLHSLSTAREEGRGPLDQNALGQLAGLDRSTVAGVVARLEAQGWLRRERDHRDARRRVVELPTPSILALGGLAPAVRSVQERMLAAVPATERDWFRDRLALLAPATVAASDHRPGHLIRLAQQRHTALWAEELGAALTGPQFAVLRVLATAGPLAQAAVAELAALDRSSASEVLSRLEVRGWIQRRPGAGDRRSRTVSLAEDGLAFMESVEAGVERVQHRILEPVPPRDRDRLVELLAVVARGP